MMGAHHGVNNRNNQKARPNSGRRAYSERAGHWAGDPSLEGKSHKQLYAQCGREGLLKVYKLLGNEFAVADAVRAKITTVMKRFRRFGITKFPGRKRAKRRRRQQGIRDSQRSVVGAKGVQSEPREVAPPNIG